MMPKSMEFFAGPVDHSVQEVKSVRKDAERYARQFVTAEDFNTIFLALTEEVNNEVHGDQIRPNVQNPERINDEVQLRFGGTLIWSALLNFFYNEVTSHSVDNETNPKNILDRVKEVESLLSEHHNYGVLINMVNTLFSSEEFPVLNKRLIESINKTVAAKLLLELDDTEDDEDEETVNLTEDLKNAVLEIGNYDYMSSLQN